MKGISPLISSVILVGITLSVALFIVPWYQNLAKEQTDIASSSSNIECAYVTLNDVSPTYTSATHKLSFQIENTGSSSVIIQRIQIIYDSGTQVEGNYTSTTLVGGGLTSVSITQATNGSNIDSAIDSVRVVTSCPQAGFTISGDSISGAT